MLNDPRPELQIMQTEPSVREFQQNAARAMLTELTRRDSLLESLARQDWFNESVSAEHDRLYRLECDAWRLIERCA